MNCVFEITLGRPFNVAECVAYKGHWCEFCDEDNGGGKFCYNCGQRESDNYGTDDELPTEVEVEVEVEDDEVEVDSDDEVEVGTDDDLYSWLLNDLKKPKLEDVVKSIKNDKKDYSYLFN